MDCVGQGPRPCARGFPDLDHAVRILAFDEPRGLRRVVLAVTVSARRAVYRDFELCRQSLHFASTQ
jgi:hypothetical protein